MLELVSTPSKLFVIWLGQPKRKEELRKALEAAAKAAALKKAGGGPGEGRQQKKAGASEPTL